MGRSEKMKEMLRGASDDDLEIMRDAHPSNLWINYEIKRRKKEKGGMEYKKSPSPPLPSSPPPSNK